MYLSHAHLSHSLEPILAINRLQKSNAASVCEHMWGFGGGGRNRVLPGSIKMKGIYL